MIFSGLDVIGGRRELGGACQEAGYCGRRCEYSGDGWRLSCNKFIQREYLLVVSDPEIQEVFVLFCFLPVPLVGIEDQGDLLVWIKHFFFFNSFKILLL